MGERPKQTALRKSYFLRFKKVGTLNLARPFPADASSKSGAMAYRPWALAELTWRRPFVDTGRLVIIRRKLPSDQVTDEFGKEFLLLCVL